MGVARGGLSGQVAGSAERKKEGRGVARGHPPWRFRGWSRHPRRPRRCPGRPALAPGRPWPRPPARARSARPVSACCGRRATAEPPWCPLRTPPLFFVFQRDQGRKGGFTSALGVEGRGRAAWAPPPGRHSSRSTQTQPPPHTCLDKDQQVLRQTRRRRQTGWWLQHLGHGLHQGSHAGDEEGVAHVVEVLREEGQRIDDDEERRGGGKRR